MAEGKNSAFALKPGGTGDVSRTSVLWRNARGLPYISSGIVVGGHYVTVKDGGLVTAYDARTGQGVYVQKRAVAPAATTPRRSPPTGLSTSRRSMTVLSPS
jgi:hypothetical protein